MTVFKSALIVGQGRAGSSFKGVLDSLGISSEFLGKEVLNGYSLEPYDICLICVPDSEISDVANSLEENDSCLVAHICGSRDTKVLFPHKNRAVIHPMAPLPTKEIGQKRLLSGLYFGVSGDDRAKDFVKLLNGRCVDISTVRSARYHLACSLASNHLVALFSYVARVLSAASLPIEPFLNLAKFSIADMEELGVGEALTGPVTRKDFDTLENHFRELLEIGLDTDLFSASLSLQAKLFGKANGNL